MNTIKTWPALLLIIFIINLNACHQTKKAHDNTSDPIPQTISQQEVARIALLETKQLLSNAENKKLDVTAAEKIYQQAQELYQKGEFKKAQITAVDARHQLEELKN